MAICKLCNILNYLWHQFVVRINAHLSNFFQLDIQFCWSSVCPTSNLITDQLDCLLALIDLFQLSLQVLQFPRTLRVIHFFIGFILFCIVFNLAHKSLGLFFLSFRLWCRSVQSSLTTLSNLQLLQSFPFYFVFWLQFIKILLAFRYLPKQVSISLFFCHELSDHFSDIRVASASFYFAESNLNLVILLHLFFHASWQELTPNLLHHKLLSHDFFILIVWFIGCFFCNFLLSFDSSHSFLQRIFFVFYWKLQWHDPLLSLLLLVVNVLHQMVQSVFAL